MTYGLPYTGSKNKIAEWIVKNLPSAETFVDLFAGGCAVTHAALFSGKYKKFIINDINGYPQVFIDAINGKYKDENRWISKEDFYRLKDEDYYVRYCWSFGNDAHSYLYGKHIEPWKKAYHYAYFYGDYSLLDEFGLTELREYKGQELRRQIRKNHAVCAEKYTKWYKEHIADKELKLGENTMRQLQNLERLNNLKRFQSFSRLQDLENAERIGRFANFCNIKNPEENLKRLQNDYKDVEIPENSVVYADPPYANTDAKYVKGFDSGAFFQWCREQPFPVYISEYNFPDDFTVIAEKKKISFLDWQTRYANSSIRTEKLGVYSKWKDKIEKEPSLF